MCWKLGAARVSRQSANRRGVLNAAFGPQRIKAASDLERRTLPDIALEHFAVIADQANDAVGPVVGQPELFADFAFGAEQALDLGTVRMRLLVEICLVDV